MTTKKVQVLASALVAALTLCTASISRAQSDSKILTAERGSYAIEMLDNSETYSQAWAINGKGAIIGQREVANEDKTIFRIEYFFYDGKEPIKMPMLEGYSNLEAIAISDNNDVVGYASRVVGHPDGSLIAVLWQPETNSIIALPRPEGDPSTHAQDISADGKRITGYATGLERMRPVVWNKADDGKWTVEVLPTLMEQNPYIMSSRVVISPDGKLIAACCTTTLTSTEVNSDLFLWRDNDGKWQREQISESQMYLRDMNNAGQIAGAITSSRGVRLPCVIFTESREVKPIALLSGDVSGEAWSINAEGIVVGFSDDPPGNEGGPQPFIWKDGKTDLIDFGDDVYGSVHSINDAGQLAGYIDEPMVAAKNDAGEEQMSGGRILAFRTLKQPSP